MYESDACSRWLGMVLEEVRPGYARLSMEVRTEFLNGHAICHGGLMFTLADSAFAFACNSYNISTVASGCSIDFLRPVQGGDVHHQIDLLLRHRALDNLPVRDGALDPISRPALRPWKNV